MHSKNADLLAALIEIIRDLSGCLTDTAHSDDYAVCILCTIVVKQMMLASGDLGQLSHSIFNELRNLVIEAINRLLLLEINIRVLSRATNERMIRIHRAITECLYCIPIEKLSEIVIVNHLNLLDFMRRTESIKEVDEWHTPFYRYQMSNCCQIHDLLYAVLAEHRTARLTCSHDIALISEYIQR